MPSIVSIARPSASTASIRHEQTRRPSTITLQAPQSPELQPSLLPVRWSSSRSTSSSVSCGSHRNSVGSSLILVDTWCLLIDAPSLTFFCALVGDHRRPPGHHARDLDPIFDGPALIVDRLAGAPRRPIEPVERRGVERASDQGGRGICNQECGRGYGAQHYPSVGA